MFDRVVQFREQLQQMVGALEPELLRPADAARLFNEFAQMQTLCSGAAMRLSPRAAAAGLWRQAGDKGPAEWIAKSTGTSVTNAVSFLETGRRLTELPDCDQAVKKGELSQRQAEEIASAATADPKAQSELIEAAKTDSFTGLKARCARVKAAACPDEGARHEQIRRSRHLRHFTDDEGAFCLRGRFTPEAGAVLMTALEPYKNRVVDEARRQGLREPAEAYLADALVSMAEDSRSIDSGSSRRKGAPATIHVTVDHSALIRGHVENEETCEIPGIGPIPVATARMLLNDAFLSVIVTHGADIKAVCHAGRTIPARLRTALESRDPVCVVPGCQRTDRLQTDHIHEYAKNGPTALDNLARLCMWHHYLKTHQGYRLSGKPGDWLFLPPEDRHTARDAGRDAARDSGRDAARDAERDAARDAGRDAARDAERDAARDAERDAARDSGRDEEALPQNCSGPSPNTLSPQRSFGP